MGDASITGIQANKKFVTTQFANIYCTKMVFKEEGIKTYYLQKIEEAEVKIKEETENLRRLEAQRNELNSKGL